MNIKFPTVNYIGNKEKISDWIVENLPIKTGVILDLFSGGGSIAYALKREGYEVLTNDSLYSAYVVNKALIENSSEKLDITHVTKALTNSPSAKTRERLQFLSNELYFDFEINELAKLVDYVNSLKGYDRYIYLALLRRAMIRKLPYSRMNISWENIKKLRDEDYSYKKYGRRRAYHNRSFAHHMKEELASYNESVFDNGKDNKAFHQDGFSLLKKLPSDYVDLIYIDPPYPGTMNNYQNFYGPFDQIFDKTINFRDLTDKRFFLENMDELFQICSEKTTYVLFSLNSNSDPSIEKIDKIAQTYGKTKIFEKKHNYQVSGKINKNRNYEQLLLVEFEKRGKI